MLGGGWENKTLSTGKLCGIKVLLIENLKLAGAQNPTPSLSILTVNPNLNRDERVSYLVNSQQELNSE